MTPGTRVILSRAAPAVTVEEVRDGQFAYRLTPTGALIWCAVGGVCAIPLA
jgi:hypothetical protein